MLTANDPVSPGATSFRRLADAARRVPSLRSGKPTHPSTLTRWILKGVRLSGGAVLKLSARRFPGGWAVTDEAIDEFVDALTRDRCGQADAVTTPGSSAARRKAADRADAELAARGL